jgi:hypothetical protein
MSLAIVLSLSAQANLLALLQTKVNSSAAAGATPVVLSAASISFGTPLAVAQTDPAGKTYNTAVIVTAQPGSGFEGSTTVYYNRIALADSVLAPQSSYTLPDAADNGTVIEQVAQALGLIPSEITLSGTVARPADGSSQTLDVLANAGSGLYTSTAFQITLTWQRDLDTLFSDPYLDGFIPTPEVIDPESTGEVSSS